MKEGDKEWKLPFRTSEGERFIYYEDSYKSGGKKVVSLNHECDEWLIGDVENVKCTIYNGWA